MDDENRQRYIPLYGDQVSAIAFCKARVSTVAEEGGKAQRATLLERLTHKNGRAKTCTRNRHAVKEKRRVELGWMNFDIRTQTYKLVRQMKGGGTRFLSVDKDSTLADIFARGQDLFFSDSNTSYQSELRDFCGNIVTHLNRTVEQCYEDTKLKILRLHVYSQRLDGSKPISSNKVHVYAFFHNYLLQLEMLFPLKSLPRTQTYFHNKLNNMFVRLSVYPFSLSTLSSGTG